MAASVNLWELITTVSSKTRDLPNQEKCEAIQAEAAGASGFGSELDLTLQRTPMGCAWTVKVFNHEDSSEYVEMTVHPSGRVTVERSISGGVVDCQEVRRIYF